jgi:hypothetical protein
MKVDQMPFDAEKICSADVTALSSAFQSRGAIPLQHWRIQTWADRAVAPMDRKLGEGAAAITAVIQAQCARR